MLMTCRADIVDMLATDINNCHLGGVADRHKSQLYQPRAPGLSWVLRLAITQSKIELTKNFKLQNYSNNYELSINAIKRVILLILRPKQFFMRVVWQTGQVASTGFNPSHFWIFAGFFKVPVWPEVSSSSISLHFSCLILLRLSAKVPEYSS